MTSNHLITTLILLMFTISDGAAQQRDDQMLKKLMENKPEFFSKILAHPNQNEVQILYTAITRNKLGKPSFKVYGYNINDERYFYPASTVKLAAVIFALEKANRLGISPYATMLTDSGYAAQTKVTKDETAANGLPSIAHYIKKILLTSDNDAFNRLFEFIGRAEINDRLHHYGMGKSRILNRLAIGDAGEASRHTNPIRFYEEKKLVYQQPAQYDSRDYPLKLTNLLVGKGYMDSNDQLVNKPYNFDQKNVFTIVDQQEMMKRLFFPHAFKRAQRFKLTSQDYALIQTYMHMLPTESDHPKYDPNEFWPTYAKMLYYGREKNAAINPDLKIYNKYGDSYGFIIDNSYFVDRKNNVEFLLTAVVQSNEDGIYNDNKYEYETVCYPFMKNIARTLYDRQLQINRGR